VFFCNSRRLNQFPKVDQKHSYTSNRILGENMYDHKHPVRWAELSQEKKNDVMIKTSAVLNTTMQYPGKTIPYEYLNKAGLEHLYRFLVDSWNDNHSGKIEILEKGIRYVK